MKKICNVSDYRNWMLDDYLHISDDIYCILSADELEEELLHHMPEQFPCLAILWPDDDCPRLTKTSFLYPAQVEKWATLLEIIDR